VQVVSLTALVTAAQGIELSYDAEEYAEYRALLATPASFAEGDESRNRNQLLAVLYYGLLRPRGDARTKAVLFQVVEIEVCKLIRYREILERLAGFSTVPAQTGQLNEEQRRDVVVILDRLRVYLARP
jgi:hypothetical protein